MPTPLASIIANKVRPALRELTPRFWSDAELLDICKDGIKDLWGAVLDVHGEHYLVVDETNVSIAASGTQLTGVPDRCFRVQYLEPRDTTSNGTAPWLTFVPAKYKSEEFAYARSLSSADVSSLTRMYYAVAGEGSPVSAPVVYIAPKLNSALNLRLAYNPTLEVGVNNPVPGESDLALKAWTLAFAMAKESPDNTPNPGWLSVYATEKASIITRIIPRQEQEPEYVSGMFEGWS